jgi:hypothetical protein
VAAYQSMLAGACGHTYGDHNIWQMWLPGRQPKSVARTPWPEALQHPGSMQMKFMRGLFESRPFWQMRSEQGLIESDNPAVTDHSRAALATDGSFCVVYIPTGNAITINLAQLNAVGIKAWWFDPRLNTSQLIGEFPKTGRRTFVPPTSGRNNDWILVIDDAAKEFPRLGSSYQNITPTVRE